MSNQPNQTNKQKLYANSQDRSCEQNIPFVIMMVDLALLHPISRRLSGGEKKINVQSNPTEDRCGVVLPSRNSNATVIAVCNMI